MSGADESWCVRVNAGQITRAIVFVGIHSECEKIAAQAFGQPFMVEVGKDRWIPIGEVGEASVEPLPLPRARGDAS